MNTESATITETKQQALIQGSLAHSLLEERLLGRELDLNRSSIVIGEWLESVCELSIASSKEAMLDCQGMHVETLLDYATGVADLLTRSAPWYEHEDRIRNKNGESPADPLAYPPSAFRQEYDALNLHRLQVNLDVSAQRQHPDFALNSISIAHTVAKALHYATSFTYPTDFASTKDVELDLNCQVKIEAIPGVIWKGYIDWVYVDINGGVTIVDHKTSKELPNQFSVSHHDQLNIYAALYFQIYGRWPDRIGISHLRSNQLISVPLDRNTATEIYNYYCNVTKEICQKDRQWLRKPASKSYSGICVKRTGTNVKPCPLLPQCWPDFNPAAIG